MPSFFAGFGLSTRDASGKITPLPGATVKIRLVGGADVATVASDAFGFVKGISINVAAKTPIEFYHQTHGGVISQKTAATLASARSPVANFIVDDQSLAFRDAVAADLYLQDLSAPDSPPQFLQTLALGAGATIPFQSNVGKNVKLFLISRSADGQTSDSGFATAESATVAVAGTGGAALGETAATAYRGDRGKIAYDHSQITNGNPHNTTAAQIGAVGATELAKIGTEWLNLKQCSSWTGGGDITNALNETLSIVNSRTPSGGQILIPRSVGTTWYTNGGHVIGQTTQIRSAGFSLADGGSSYRGGCLTLNAGSPYNYIFFIGGNTQNVGIFDLMLDGSAKSGSSIGLWYYGTSGNYHVKTELEGVFFKGCRFGIKNESVSGTNFQNDGFSATNCGWQNCQTAFYCNSLNGSFYFKKPVIYLPYNGIAFDVPVIGTLFVSNYHITGTSGYNSANEVNDYSTVLVTGGQHNRITFCDGGQCEQVRWFHQDNTNNHYPGSPILIKDCSIQSRFRPVAGVTYIIEDNYIVNHAGYPTFIDDIAGSFVRVIKKGQNFVETRAAQPGAAVIVGTSENPYLAPFRGTSVLNYFTKTRSHIMDARGNLRASNAGEPYQDAGTPYNKPYRMPSYSAVGNGGTTTVNSTEGTVNVAAGASYFNVYNNTMHYQSADDCSIVQAWIEDEPGVSVSKCAPGSPDGYNTYFTVFLTGATTAQRKINFRVLR